MSELKTDHPYLYRRVRVKAITHMLLGLSLLFLSPSSTPYAAGTALAVVFHLKVLGSVFLFASALIWWSLYQAKNDYKAARIALVITGLYSMIWLIALLASWFFSDSAVASITILWGYFTYNQFVVALEPAWKGIRIVKHIDELRGDRDGT